MFKGSKSSYLRFNFIQLLLTTWKHAFGFHHLPVLAIQPLNDIGRDIMMSV